MLAQHSLLETTVAVESVVIGVCAVDEPGTVVCEGR
jgi:hypothetical protein